MSIFFVLGQERDTNYKALKFKNLSLKEGLSQSTVLSILQDKKGFLWFGTRDGLNKYDGNEFTIFRHKSQDTTSLNDNYIKTLFEDTKGNLWVGTLKGLNKFIPETNSFQRSSLVKTEDQDIEIWSIVEDSEGFLWLGTNLGLQKYDADTDTILPIEFKNTDERFFQTPTRSLLLTSSGDLFIKTTDQIGSYHIKSKTFKTYCYPENLTTEINKNNVSILYQDKDKNVWLGFEKGLTKLNENTGVFELFRTNSGNIITDYVRSISEDYLGNLWIGTYNGIYILNAKKENSLLHFTHDENDSNSLSQNSIFKVYRDTKGDIWIGTYSGGISYYDRSFDIFTHISSGTNKTKLNYKVVSALVEDSNNNLWVATEGGGVNVYNKETGTFKYYTNSNKKPNSISANNVKAMIQDHSGNFWIGTHDGGLNFLNPKVEPYTFKKFRNNPYNENSISSDRVISLFESYDANIWIGTSGGGLNVLDIKTKTTTRINDPLELAGKIIYAISKTSDKENILIGGNKGLARVNVSSKTVLPIDFLIKNKDSFTSRSILSIYEDKNKNIWVGTEGDGVYYWNTTAKSIKKYDVSNGLPNDVIYGIVEDNDNHIWLSTNFGLSRINLQSFQIKNFNESDGLQSSEFNYGACLKNKNGTLLFGGSNGFNVFKPSDIVENSFVPPVVINSLTVNNKPYLIITDSIKKVGLTHRQNVFNFDFVALSYSQPNKNQYAYKLEGFDSNWNYVGNKKSATYTNLDAGDYVFKVKASNNDGLWNEKGTALLITILPAPWRTIWAYLIYVLFAIGLLLVIRKYSLIRIRERNELKLERQDKERIEEVNQLKLELFTNISHDFRTPLTLILGPLERLLKSKNEDSFIQGQHEIMYRNASTLMELITQLLDFRKSESGKLELNASKANIVSFVNEIKLAFDDLATNKNIDFSITTSSAAIEVWFDQTKFKKVIFNLLSNAFKFTEEGGTISLEISVHDKQKKEAPKKCVRINVIDNGIGISKTNKKFIFDRFYQLGERSGTGIGLALTKNLVELHRGTIKVKSNENKGTTFSVQLPLGNSHLSKNQLVESKHQIEQNLMFNLEKAAYVDKAIVVLNVKEQTKETLIDNGLSSLLIVEDNEELRAFITSIFVAKYNVYQAENGEKGLAISKTKDIDLIISDVMMPVMDGIEMCNELKTNIKTSHIPIILLTAKTSQEAQKSGYQIGADVYITKPFDANILEIRVENLLKSRKSLIDKFKKDIILQPKELTVTSADEMFLKKAIEIVEENLSNQEFSITDFISEMGVSRSVLYRKLIALTGQPISEFIKTIKLKRAAQLIKQTDMNISEIAFDLGFNDLKHFRKSFKKVFNTLPSQYRDITPN
ncbi:response regulator [Cellulophaga sp. E16_2]|uniref:hybrid sensor histidine kinase/response regulator transcription factor n=1 Tax=unclassified Cellulophaga TaxID=2634405 RepID=UPI0013FE4096|nr:MULTISPECIES: two-component regulator propeller domain-containing protein [unclassified Cellulophaga]MBO0593205.1 response regulator [Cellulophaga sp. E16_2]